MTEPHGGRQSRGGQDPHGSERAAGGQQPGAQSAGPGQPPETSQPAAAQPARNIPIQPVGVDRLATDDIVTADPDTPVATVVATLAERNVGSVVVAEDDRPVGIVTDRHIALALEERPDLTERAVEEIMTENPVTVGRDTDLFDAIRTLRDHEVRRVPVVDDDGRLSGILSLDDVLVVLGGELSAAVDVVESQSPRF